MCDVCIVGDGPAGLAAAIELTASGASVTVVGRADGADYPVPVRWETLASPAAPLLEHLGCSAIMSQASSTPVAAHVSTWGSDRIAWADAIMHPAGLGRIINRQEFDSALLYFATGFGVRVVRHAHSRIERLADSFSVRASGNDRCPLVARFLIDATGRNAFVAQRLGARRLPVDRLVARWLLVKSTNDWDSTVRVDAVSDGWCFSLKAGDKRLIAFFTDGDLCPDRTERFTAQCLRSRIREAPACQSVVDSVGDWTIMASGVTSAATGALDMVAGRDWVAAGDAAQSYDPLTSLGLYHALLSGCRAARAIIDHLNGDTGAFDEYNMVERKKFAAYVKDLWRQYKVENRWAKSPFWYRRHLLPKSEGLRSLFSPLRVNARAPSASAARTICRAPRC
jgi:flavin-dependent dehydrogenase